MADELHIHNWDKWQFYRSDRHMPPWIKLHRAVLRSPKWVRLSDAQRGQLVCIWMLAADDEGWVPNDQTLIRKVCCLDADPDLNLFIELGFLDANLTRRKLRSDVKKASNGRQPDLLEKSREEERREEKKDSVRDALLSVLDAQHADAVIDHRRAIRKAFTPYSLKLLVGKLSKCPDPNAAADLMIERGWTSIDPDWVANAKRRRGAQQETTMGGLRLPVRDK
jgi:hypothetical protein